MYLITLHNIQQYSISSNYGRDTLQSGLCVCVFKHIYINHLKTSGFFFTYHQV